MRVHVRQTFWQQLCISVCKPQEGRAPHPHQQAPRPALWQDGGEPERARLVEEIRTTEEVARKEEEIRAAAEEERWDCEEA